MNASKLTASRAWPTILLRLFKVLLLLVFSALLIGYAFTFNAYRKAQTLLLEMQAIEAGKTTAAEVQALVKRFHAEQYDAHSYSKSGENERMYAQPDPCLDDSPSYGIGVSPPLLVFTAVQKFPALQLLGLHPWFVSVGIQIKGGKVSCFSQSVWYIRRDGQEIGASADFEQRNPDSIFEKAPYQVDSFVSRSFYHRTRATLLNGASAKERTRAFQMDTSCMVSLRGCYFPCQILPNVWTDTVQERHFRGESLPEGAGDPRCPATGGL